MALGVIFTHDNHFNCSLEDQVCVKHSNVTPSSLCLCPLTSDSTCTMCSPNDRNELVSVWIPGDRTSDGPNPGAESQASILKKNLLFFKKNVHYLNCLQQIKIIYKNIQRLSVDLTRTGKGEVINSII